MNLVFLFLVTSTKYIEGAEECVDSLYDFGVAENQLAVWKASHRVQPVATGPAGSPLPSLTNTLGIGAKGPILLQDLAYLNHMGSFVAKRIPDRVVHAKGAGAFGYFITKNSQLPKFTGAKIFQSLGKKTHVVVRFSTTNLESGSADTVIESRGIAVKFYTDQGNWDLTMVSVPAFDNKDPMLFPAFKVVNQRNPRTNLKYTVADADMLLLKPAKMLNKMLSVSDLGRVKNYRVMSGFSCNTFKLTRGTNGKVYYARFQMLAKAKFQWFTANRYKALAGIDPDYMTRDLYNAIAQRKFPRWGLYVQMFTDLEASKLNVDAFDPTKYLPVKDFPLTYLGTLVLNRNPKNFYADVEQAAFQPGNLIPGIEIGPDRNLQGRVFAYAAAQRHRLGMNFEQLPVNRPRTKLHTYQRDGFMNILGNNEDGPNYYPNSYNGPMVDEGFKEANMKLNENVIGRSEYGQDENYVQVGKYWKEEMQEGNRNRTIQGLVSIAAPKGKEYQQRFVEAWSKGDAEIGARIQAALNRMNKRKKPKGNRLDRETDNGLL